MLVSLAKFTILISWSPICIPLIFVPGSMKIANTSVTIMHHNIENGQPCRDLQMNTKELDILTIYSYFRLEIDGSHLSHVNEFILVIELTEKNEIPEKLKSQATRSNALTKAKEITARGLSNVFDRSGLNFSLLQRFLNLFFSLEILVFYCVVEFLESYFAGKFIFGKIQRKRVQIDLKKGLFGFN